MRDYEVENKINLLRGDCSNEQAELVEGTVKLADDLDSITMDSIKAILPDKFSEICIDSTDEESMKALVLLAKLMGIYKDSIALTRLSAVVSAQNGGQLNRIEKKLDNFSKQINYIERKIDKILEKLDQKEIEKVI